MRSPCSNCVHPDDSPCACWCHKPEPIAKSAQGGIIDPPEIIIPLARLRDPINPLHYGGSGNIYEHVKVAEHLGWTSRAFIYNCTKYLWRLGRKFGSQELEDLRKAQWYLNREIARFCKPEKDLATLKEDIKKLREALLPFAEIGADMTNYHCHFGLCSPEKCGRCSRALKAQAALKETE